ncbi:hypothetical protein [Liquorilactobacillus nagelii]|uniref:hypothetical protein n=1 Tax=Liquorilactobacillus nagelii TaxID=82688 RepID=UPI0039E79940
MKYKKGDKVVVEIKETHPGYSFINIKGNVGHVIDNKEILGKLEDFNTAQEKIKMTVEEKKEFDKLLGRRDNSYPDLNDFLKIICECPQFYPALHKKLFGNLTAFFDRKEQFKFARALEHPDLIEVEKPKRYYIHLFPGERGYLNKFKKNSHYTISDKCELDSFQVAFTKEEIDKIPQDALKITDKALEEVEEDE